MKISRRGFVKGAIVASATMVASCGSLVTAIPATLKSCGFHGRVAFPINGDPVDLNAVSRQDPDEWT